MQRCILDDELDYAIRSAARGDKEAFILALKALFPRGHTSGIDISAEMIPALSLIQDLTFKKREIETRIAKSGLSP